MVLPANQNAITYKI